MRSVLAVITTLFFAAVALAVTAPERATAGQDVTIRANGSEVYVVCPGYASKHKVEGGSATISGDELQTAGRCVVSDGNSSAVMWVAPAPAARINFLAQPSRVPVAQSNAISGTVFVFDKWNNMVITPTPVKFELAVEGAPSITRTVQSNNGVAFVRTDSSKKEGNANFVASVGDVNMKRVVRQVAAEPCGGTLRMTAHPEKNGILVETAPVRDCSGNPVPDGTIVTFTSVDPKGRSTVDARVKKGVATAMLPSSDHADISVASGITVGNEIRWSGGGGK